MAKDEESDEKAHLTRAYDTVYGYLLGNGELTARAQLMRDLGELYEAALKTVTRVVAAGHGESATGKESA